jgi:hypothetical protein
MTEEEWLACANPRPMFDFLTWKAGVLRWSQFAAACFRRVAHCCSDRRVLNGIEILERLAEGEPVSHDELRSATAAGARAAGSASDVPSGALVDAVLAEVETELVTPLRERLTKALDDAHGDTVEASATLRAAYREWRTQRADEVAGHLVFTTVHANNVVDVLGRFLNMKVEPYNFVSALNCVLAQRLVRMICQRCKTEVRYTAKQLEESGIDPRTWKDHIFYEGKGCAECNGTGYMGRMAIAEILDMSDRIRELILDRKSAAEIKRAAREEGMAFMRDAAVARVLEGRTTLREINKVTFVE